MIIINNKAYYTQNEKLDGRLFLGQLQENYISLWNKWFQDIPESQTYDYTDINAWYETHPKNYNGSWEEWYQQRPAIPDDLATDALEGWGAWEKQHPKFPDASIIDKFGHVKKIYVDYPAYVQTTYNPQSRQEDDGLEKGLYYDPASTNSRVFLSSIDKALPTENINIRYLNSDSNEPKYHRALVYPDENYLDIHQNTVRPWLDWLSANAQNIAMRFLDDSNTSTVHGINVYNNNISYYVLGLRSLINDLKTNENLDQYKYGILGVNAPIGKSHATAPFPIISLYAGDYIKRNKYLEPKNLTDKWMDYTLCENDCIEGSDVSPNIARLYPDYGDGVSLRTFGLTIGFLDTISETDFINKRLSIHAIAPISYTFLNASNPDYAFLYYEEHNQSFGIKKLNNTVHKQIATGINGNEIILASWNNYSVLNLPFYTVAFENDEEHLYNQYSFGKDLKYKKRFISSPVFTFPRFTGYCSHAIRYNEGVVPGR